MKIRMLLISALVVSAPLVAFAAPLRDADNVEAPELGRSGQYAIGTTYRELEVGERTTLTPTGPQQAKRSLGVRFWYPAQAATGKAAVYRYPLIMADKSAHEIVEHGAAFENAAVAKGKYPLVVISHGFGGWSEQLSRLGEHLASRGYIVASIDHRDMKFDSVPTFLLSFGKVLGERSLDQRQVIRKLADPAFAKIEPALAAADVGKVGLIGYSMGGFGALGTSGASYDVDGKPFAALPGPFKTQAILADQQASALVDSVVLLAPWGGQPDNRAWSASGLAGMKKPALFIGGDQDDIVNFKEGVRWLFNGATGSDRYMLVYRDAAHNIAGNPADLGSKPSADAIGYVRDPVWRQERLNQINQHFVTAFLDLTLKGDAAKRKFLDVPTPLASDGEWQVPFGTMDGGVVAGDGQPKFWRGFQRQWATGLELHCKQAGQ
jgi:pimeloyl-ACP methyl ester carboxylesterase